LTGDVMTLGRFDDGTFSQWDVVTVISLTLKNFINFAISICIYDYSTLGD